jgi:nucleotide-binding universal stress UspA family protein
VRPLIDKLRHDWELWDKVKRGDHLRDLVSRGWSIRGLAFDLDVPPTTLRRYMTLSSLPDSDREALKAGESAKKALARKAVKDRADAGQKRLDDENKSGAPSDKVADIILDFCKNGVPDAPIRDFDLPIVLEDVRRFTRGELGPAPPFIQLPKKITLPELYRITRPSESTDEDWLGHRVIWLAKIMMAIAPEFEIRETAMNKAEKRAGELGVQPTPEEAHQIKM